MPRRLPVKQSPIKESDWIEFFPFKKVRSEQATAINFIIDQINLGKNYIVAELGTGLGKSAIALTVSKYLQSKKTPLRHTC
jgi:Rad3-related DNA helicase